jgi:DNA-binding CsgD family transcriptional regulator
VTPERQDEIAAAVLEANPGLRVEWARRGKLRADRDVILLQLRAQGVSNIEAAKVLGITKQSVSRAIRRLTA